MSFPALALATEAATLADWEWTRDEEFGVLGTTEGWDLSIRVKWVIYPSQTGLRLAVAQADSAHDYEAYAKCVVASFGDEA